MALLLSLNSVYGVWPVCAVSGDTAIRATEEKPLTFRLGAVVLGVATGYHAVDGLGVEA